MATKKKDAYAEAFAPTAAEKAETARKQAEVDSSFARREREKTTPKPAGRFRAGIGARFEDARKQGGGIQPKPADDKPTPLEQAGKAISGVVRRVTQRRKSPSTIHRSR